MSGISWIVAQASPATAAGPPTADQLLGFVLLDITVILIAARLLGSLAKNVGQPAVVGEIIAGVLLGPTLLGPTVFTWTGAPEFLHCQQFLAAATPAGQAAPPPSITSCVFPLQSQTVLGILGQIALVFFMFLVGLELDYTLLKGKAKGIVLVSLGAIVLPFLLAFVVGPYLFNVGGLVGPGNGGPPSQLGFTLLIASMLLVTAFPVMARILQEKRLTRSAMGAIGVAAAAVVTVVMFLSVGLAGGVVSNQSAAEITLRFAYAAAYLLFMFLIARRLLEPLGRRFDARGSMSPPMFAVIVIVFFASSFVANLIGINVIVGGFVAGAILPSRAGLFSEVARRLADVTAVVLLPIFLAFSGLKTDFTKLGLDNVVPIAIFIIAGIVGKWLGSALAARLGGLTWTEGNILGVLMNCRGLLVLVVGLIGFTAKVISAPMQAGGVLMALVTTMMTGPLFDVFAKKLPPPEATPASGLSPAPEGFRIVVGIGELSEAAEVAQAAFAIATAHPSPTTEVILCRAFPLPHRETLLAGSGEEAAEAERTMRSLKILQRFAPSDITTTPLAFGSSQPVADTRTVATERHCDLLFENGRDVRTAHGPVDSVDFAVVRYQLPRHEDSATPDGPVLLVDPTEENTFAAQLATALADANGTTVHRSDESPDVESLDNASAIVAVGSAIDPKAAPVARRPTYIVELASVHENAASRRD